MELYFEYFIPAILEFAFVLRHLLGPLLLQELMFCFPLFVLVPLQMNPKNVKQKLCQICILIL